MSLIHSDDCFVCAQGGGEPSWSAITPSCCCTWRLSFPFLILLFLFHDANFFATQQPPLLLQGLIYPRRRCTLKTIISHRHKKSSAMTHWSQVAQSRTVHSLLSDWNITQGGSCISFGCSEKLASIPRGDLDLSGLRKCSLAFWTWDMFSVFVSVLAGDSGLVWLLCSGL